MHDHSLFLRWQKFKYPVKLLSPGLKTSEKKFLSSLCPNSHHSWRPGILTDQKAIWQIHREVVHLWLLVLQWTQFSPESSSSALQELKTERKATPWWFICFYTSYLYLYYWPLSDRRYQPTDGCFEWVGWLFRFHVLYFNYMWYEYTGYICYIYSNYCGDTKSVLDIPK